ncbi:MAG: zinc ribbon domain-containing protein [Zoogloeaceae bacterium]|jgi:hypothetical protein|nr:zinc ribbon domain-containing protein [Zoogloeaceae bacterium]
MMQKHLRNKGILFDTAKWIAFIFALCALAGSLFSLAGLLRSFGGGHFEVPAFNVKAQKDVGNLFHLDDSDSPEAQKERLEISGKYGQRVLDVITKNNIANLKQEEIIAFMQQEIPEERRGEFVSGWEAYLAAGLGFIQNNKRLNDAAAVNRLSRFFQEAPANYLTRQYQEAFTVALSKTDLDEARIEGERLWLLGKVVALALLFAVAMIVPLLVSIERSLRLGILASSQKPVGTTPLCPRCHKPIAFTDTFCGECGAPLRAE